MILAAKAFAFTLFLSATFAGVAMYLAGDPGGLYLAASATMVCTFILPFIARLVPPDPFSPLALATGALLLGSGLRVPYVLFSSESRAEFLMFGSDFYNIPNYSVVMCVAALFFVFGYTTIVKRLPISVLPLCHYDVVLNGRFKILLITFAVTGGVSAIVFINSAGIDLSSGLLTASRKAFIIHETAAGDAVAGAGGLPRFLVNFAEVPLLILAALLITKRVRPSFTVLLLITAAAIPVFFIPFLTSSRSAIVLVLVKVGIVAYYFDRLKIRHVLIGFVLITMTVTVMGNLRERNMAGIYEGRSVLGSIVGSGNGLDIIRTAGIMDRVPQVAPYLHGKTYLSLLTFYVPRSIWAAKPDVALGPWVKEQVFGHPVPGNNGWPSGMIAEAYINFGMLGVPVVMLLFGALLRLVYNSFLPYLGVSLPMTVFYALFAWRLGFGMIGLNFAHSVSQILISVIPMLLFFVLLGHHSKRVQHPALA